MYLCLGLLSVERTCVWRGLCPLRDLLFYIYNGLMSDLLRIHFDISASNGLELEKFLKAQRGRSKALTGQNTRTQLFI